jgi:hypothetical protein
MGLMSMDYQSIPSLRNVHCILMMTAQGTASDMECYMTDVVLLVPGLLAAASTGWPEPAEEAWLAEV